MKLRSIAFVLGCTIMGIAEAAPTELAIRTADGPRHALVVTAGEGPQPTVLVLHGALGTAEITLRSTGFAEATQQHGFTAVYPDGIDRQWHDGRIGGHGSVDDVAFLRALVERLVADRIARPDAVYLAGISNGGMMSLTMMCKASELFAGVGTIIANLPAGIGACALKPVPAVMINGTADPMVPYRGGEVGLGGGRGMVESVDATLALLAKADACAAAGRPDPIAKKDPSAATSAFRIDWQGCRPGTSLTAYRVDGGGHALPGRPAIRLFGGRLGPSNQDFDSAEAIIDVFAQKR